MKLVLLTGFLGAGKTTLLTRLLDDFKGSKIGVIVNEFGKTGIDGRLISNNGIDMMELNNGSVFCACIKQHFIEALIQMSAYSLDTVIVEASGLSDPSNMKSILQTVNSRADRTYDYAGSICVLDAVHFMEQADVFPAIDRQIAHSSVLILNKVDLQTEAAVQMIEDHVASVNADAVVHRTSYCRTHLEEIVGNLVMNNSEPTETTNTVESRPRTFVLRSNETFEREQVEAFIGEISRHTFRIKGFIKTTEGICQVSAVREQLTVEPWAHMEEETELVMISSVDTRIIRLVMEAQEKIWNGLLFRMN